MLVLRDEESYLYNYRSIKKGNISADMIVSYRMRPSVNTMLENENAENYLKR